MYKDTINKLLSDTLDDIKESSKFKLMDNKEKAQYIKSKFNLTHGKGKRKKKG